MSNQFGFDFGDELAAAPAVLPAGSWLSPKFTTQDYEALLTKAETEVQRIAGAGRCLFRQGIEAAKTGYGKLLARIGQTTNCAHSLGCTDMEPPESELTAFVAHCFAMAGASCPGFEYKTRRQAHMLTVAMYAEGVGTVIVREWQNKNIGVDYHPWRDSFFLPSFRDDLQAVYAPRSLWAATYCADKIAYSDNKPASVPTFALNNREYINDGQTGHGNYYEAEGWSICALADWRGPTYSYRTQGQAWNEGTLERGDRRGLVVSVRGQLCVIDGVILVYDDKATEPLELPPDDNDPSSDREDWIEAEALA